MNSPRRGTPDLSGAMWRRSTYSGGNNECLELARGVATSAPVRDSKNPGTVILFTRETWRAFIDHLA